MIVLSQYEGTFNQLCFKNPQSLKTASLKEIILPCRPACGVTAYVVFDNSGFLVIRDAEFVETLIVSCPGGRTDRDDCVLVRAIVVDDGLVFVVDCTAEVAGIVKHVQVTRSIVIYH